MLSSEPVIALRLFPVVISTLLIAAHFLRSGNLVAVGVFLTAPLLLLVRRAWIPRLMQAGLAFSAVVWVMTTWKILQVRWALEAPYATAFLIFGAVIAWTIASALIFETRSLRKHYGRC